MTFNESDIAELKKLLSSPKKIAIITHVRPDGDAMGSGLGLANWLQNNGHEATLVAPSSFDPNLNWMKGSESVIVFNKEVAAGTKVLAEAEIVFCLDFSAAKRVGDAEDALRNAKGYKVMIDHHLDPEDFTDLQFHVEGASSTCELVYWVLEQMGGSDQIDVHVSECLYTGIITDTGSFRFSSTTPDTHRIATKLHEKGIDSGKIFDQVFNNFSVTRNRFLGFILNEKMTVLPEYHTSYMIVTLKDQELFNVQQGDMEGFVNYNLTMKGINFGVLIKEAEGCVKFSFRSTGSFPCNDFAKHFNGGGHFNASGGRTTDSLEEVEKRFLSLLDEYKPQLEY